MNAKATVSAADDEKASTRLISVNALGSVHRDSVVRAISNILDTDVARTTYAQIVEGAPLADVLQDEYGGPPLFGPDHPVRQHKTLCPGALEKAENLYASFDVGNIEFNATLLHEFESSSPGSRVFNTRLIEISAIAVHQLAAMLWISDERLHKDDEIATWQPPPENELFWDCYPDGIKYPMLTHRWYSEDHHYPRGTADRVGFWAENRIIGGVLLFDRRDKHANADPHAVYIHSDRSRVTYRICKLLDTQKHQLLQFLSNTDNVQEVCALPILPGDDNKDRVDPEEPIVETGIYRELWERVDRPKGDARLGDVFGAMDYPTREDVSRAKDRAARREMMDDEKLHSFNFESLDDDESEHSFEG